MFITKTSQYVTQPILLLILLNTISTGVNAGAICRTSSLGRYFILRNPHSGLVVEGSSPYVTHQHYTGSNSQLWLLEFVEGGQFYFINKSNGKVLDVENWKSIGNTNIVLREKIGTTANIYPAYDYANAACQKWFIQYKNNIVNACGKDALEIRDFVYKAGAIARTWALHDGDNQKFILQYVEESNHL